MAENRPSSIMVVDDTPENLSVLQKILSTAHYEVRPLANGEQALRAARAEVPDLILLDIMMPGLNGYEVCARLKTDPTTRDVPVIFISALHNTEDKVRAFAAGGVDYVSKPFQVDEVLARVATHLRLSALQQSLREHNQQLQEAAAVFEVSNDGIALTDAQAVIQRINSAFTEITGYSEKEVVGQTPKMFKSGRHTPEFYAQLWYDILHKGFWEGEIWNRHKNGSIYPQWQRITAIYGEQGNISGYVSQFSEITRRKLTEREIRYRGNYDALTGLANRSLLLERLEYALKEHRHKARKFCLLAIGLDRFKQVNEALSHVAGDVLLQQVANHLRAEVRDIDTAARIGGDEFVLLLTDSSDQLAGERIAGLILDRLAQPFILPAGHATIGASIGISLFPDDGDNAEVLLRNAMLAMSRAKSGGGHRFCFFTESMGRASLERHRLEADLRQAMAGGELTIHYQPIVDLRSGFLVGVESLLRWQHPSLGEISPVKFIPIAEQSGLIQSIGFWVIENVCRQLATWHDKGWKLYASVNVSMCQVPHLITPTWLRELTERLGLAAECLVLEITESLLAENIESITAWLSNVRALGFRVSLDDFGTGYSSLSYLNSFPVDFIKIDQAFVRDMVEQPRSQSLIRALIAMSRSLELQVVAEGIETSDQQALLHDANCSYGQGYLFSRPLSAGELETVLQERLRV